VFKNHPKISKKTFRDGFGNTTSKRVNCCSDPTQPKFLAYLHVGILCDGNNLSCNNMKTTKINY
jgi:hypothetical protein